MRFTTRPTLMGTHGVVASGHYLSSAIGLEILKRGGNAIDAGVAMGFALSVLEPQSYGIGGEAPILIYSAKERVVYSVKGQGYAPRKATVEWFKKNRIKMIPWDGFLPATIPGAFDAFATTLLRFGTISLKEALEPAVKLAEEGFPVYERMHLTITSYAERMQRDWPTSAEIYLPKGDIPEIGQVLRNRDWAHTFQKVIEEEQRNLPQGREDAIKSARDLFYKGFISEKIVQFVQENEFMDATGTKHRGLLSLEDLGVHDSG